MKLRCQTNGTCRQLDCRGCVTYKGAVRQEVAKMSQGIREGQIWNRKADKPGSFAIHRLMILEVRKHGGVINIRFADINNPGEGHRCTADYIKSNYELEAKE